MLFLALSETPAIHGSNTAFVFVCLTLVDLWRLRSAGRANAAVLWRGSHSSCLTPGLTHSAASSTRGTVRAWDTFACPVAHWLRVGVLVTVVRRVQRAPARSALRGALELEPAETLGPAAPTLRFQEGQLRV